MADWISMDDRLPPACDEILACNIHRTGRRMPFIYYVGTYPSECRVDITHWMPLPKVPPLPQSREGER